MAFRWTAAAMQEAAKGFRRLKAHNLQQPLRQFQHHAGRFRLGERASSVWRSPYMSLRADKYRERAAEAKDRAAQARDPFIKSAFENVAAGWVALAEQVERIEREKSSATKKNNRLVR
jgi:hypothetical protein